jgi:hypothetical protein
MLLSEKIISIQKGDSQTGVANHSQNTVLIINDHVSEK